MLDLPALRAALDDLRQYDSALWRHAVDAGVRHLPAPFVRHSPVLFGLGFAAGLGRQRRAVLRNLRLALGRRNPLVEAADVARVFTNFAQCMTEAFAARASGGAGLRARQLNDERYGSAYDEGHGVILATAHTGGWQTAGPLLRARLGPKIMVVMRPERDPRAQALQDAVHDREGVQIHVGKHPLDALPLLSHLRKGGVVAIQMDRVPEGMRARESSLFGVPWKVPEGPLKLAAVSRAPIIPVFTRRVGHLEYELLVSPAIRLPRRPTEEDLDAAARGILVEMETFVRANPTQWFHFE